MQQFGSSMKFCFILLHMSEGFKKNKNGLSLPSSYNQWLTIDYSQSQSNIDIKTRPSLAKPEGKAKITPNLL